jgi:hypothetical protein
LLAAAPIAACAPAAPTTAGGPTPTPIKIDVTGWATTTHGVGPVATVKSGLVEFSLPASTHNDQNPNDLIVRVTAPCQLSGDFDITAHYHLVNWPLNNAVWVGIWTPEGNVARASSRMGTDNSYASYLAQTISRVETADTSGTVRLSRVGTTMSGYYQGTTGEWVKIASGAGSTEPITYSIGAWCDAGFGERQVTADIDGLDVTGTKVNCS